MNSTVPSTLHFSGDVELRPSLVPRPQIRHIVFDFDGTLSWIRHGWPRLMLDVFHRYLPVRAGETEKEIETLLLGIALGMAGKPTVVQMARFAEIAVERGGAKLEAEALRQEYQDRLDQEIAARAELIRSGKAQPDDFVVFGARALLEKLAATDLTVTVLSTTTETRVKEEAELLQIAKFFGGRINGSAVDASKFSKRVVFERILREEGLTGDQLLSFGDGPVEIADTKELGGLAIAICSDEDHNGSGIMDAHKRAQLLAAGADAALPDFRDAAVLIDYLLGR